MTMIDVDKQSGFEPGTSAVKPDDNPTRTQVDAKSEARAGTETPVGAGAEPARDPGQDRSESQNQNQPQASNQDRSQSQNRSQGQSKPQEGNQVVGETGETGPAGHRGLQEELESLRAEAAAWKEKAEFNWDQFLRARADLDNYRKRVERDLALRIRLGKRELILGFLEVLDNLERVVQAGKGLVDGSACSSGNAPALLAGVEMIKRQMEALLRAEGVVPVDCLGKPFDPSLAEAVGVVEGEGEPGTVVEVILKGYTYGGDLLRPARVKVAK